MTRAVWAATFLLCSATPAAAQTRYPAKHVPRAGAVEVSASGVWMTGYDAGSQSATESTNNASTPLTLFTSSSSVSSAAGGEARLGVYASKRISIEGFVQATRPTLRTQLGDDFENAAAVTAETTVTTYVLGGTLLYHFGDGRLSPFIGGGAGYVRHMYEDNADVLTGSEVHGGGGVDYWFGTRGRRFGLRFDAEASSRSKSVGFDDKRRILPVVGAGITVVF